MLKKINIVWLAVDEDGFETIHKEKPFRHKGCWQCGEIELTLPKGSIKKLIGKELSWEDEPFELYQKIQ